METWSRTLNIVGVAILIVEVFDLRDKLERLLDAFRLGMLKVIKGAGALIGDLTNWGPIFGAVLVGVIFLVGTMFAVPEARIKEVSDGVYALAVASGLLVGLVAVLLFPVWAVLWLLDKFPKGSVAGIGACCAIASVVMDYV